jgi:hypothetical protein
MEIQLVKCLTGITECHGLTMKKAMNINFHPGRDDLYFNRLFSYLKSRLPMEIDQITEIRSHVYLVENKQLKCILKAFPTYEELKLQQDFTSSIKKEGFEQTCSFLKFGDFPLCFENRFLGFMEYIQPDLQSFSYLSDREREEGVELLARFHKATEKLVPEFETILFKQDLRRKWEVRAEQFQKNISILHYFIPKSVTEEILEWARISLKGMTQSTNRQKRERPVILHGDVAHHNYIRAKTGQLYIIDFDLIAIGPVKNDLLQYANRILPFTGWSFDSLEKMKIMGDYLTDPSFLYGLMYPSDIFREWNRNIRAKAYYNPKRTTQLINMTVHQFQERKLFVNKLIDILEP